MGVQQLEGPGLRSRRQPRGAGERSGEILRALTLLRAGNGLDRIVEHHQRLEAERAEGTAQAPAPDEARPRSLRSEAGEVQAVLATGADDQRSVRAEPRDQELGRRRGRPPHRLRNADQPRSPVLPNQDRALELGASAQDERIHGPGQARSQRTADLPLAESPGERRAREHGRASSGRQAFSNRGSDGDHEGQRSLLGGRRDEHLGDRRTDAAPGPQGIGGFHGNAERSYRFGARPRAWPRTCPGPPLPGRNAAPGADPRTAARTTPGAALDHGTHLRAGQLEAHDACGGLGRRHGGRRTGACAAGGPPPPFRGARAGQIVAAMPCVAGRHRKEPHLAGTGRAAYVPRPATPRERASASPESQSPKKGYGPHGPRSRNGSCGAAENVRPPQFDQ